MEDMTAHKRRHTMQPFALCKLSYPLFCLNIANVGHPLGVRLFSMKLAVWQVLVLVQLLAHLLPLSTAAVGFKAFFSLPAYLLSKLPHFFPLAPTAFQNVITHPWPPKKTHKHAMGHSFQ